MLKSLIKPREATHIKIPKRAFLEVFWHVIGCVSDIIFFWGGRDSGKSHFIAQQLIIKCLTAKYFRCILIKKTFGSIQESQWQTIKDIIEDWGLSHLFIFRVAPLGITCVLNGNRFIARGLDDPQSIKSVKDPTDAWHEEGNQEELDDFITVTTTLRTNKAKIQQWFSFNPECDGDYEEFWLYKTFFKGKPLNGTFTWTIDTPKGPKEFTYTSVHTTYHTNTHCSAERIAFLEQLKEISPYYYQVYVKGLWGRRENKSPFFYAFDREKHTGPTVWNPYTETILSFDFNRSPITCQVWQWYEPSNELIGVEAIKLDNSDIYALCKYIRDNYPGAVFLVTGDATGRNSTALVQNGLHYYTVIKTELDLSDTQIKVPGANPLLKESQVISNAVLVKINVKVDPVKCRPLVYDLSNVRVNADGTIEKKDRNDPAQQADQADCFRYLCNTFFKWVLRQ